MSSEEIIRIFWSLFLLLFYIMNNIDKFYVINLDERTDRLNHFLQECSIHKIPNDKITKYSAINGKTYSFSNKEQELFKNVEFNNHLLTPYIISKKLMANQLSHYNILNEMKSKNYDNIIIFQDDIVLKEGFMNYIEEIMNDLPDDAEIINFGLHKLAKMCTFEAYDLTVNDIDNNILEKQVTNFVYKYKIYNSETLYRVNPASLGYIVTKKGCQNYLEYIDKNEGFTHATDWNYNLYLQSKDIFYGSKYILATGNNYFKSDVFVPTDNLNMDDLIDINYFYTDKNTTHSYFNLYEELFNPIRKSAKNILEIGIGDFSQKNGGSLLLWRLFFENAIIHGVDIIGKDRVYDMVLRNNNIKTYLNSNAYDQNLINKLFIENNVYFDVIIDDGPHTFQTQCDFISLYSNLLTEQGILVLEDIPNIEWIEKFIELTPEHLKKYIHSYDLRHIKNRFDDIVFVINKNVVNTKFKNTDLYYTNIDNPIVISYETDNSNKNSIAYKKTLEKNNWDFKFIGESLKWNGFMDKIKNYYNEIKLYHDDKVIILTDARDVFCLRSSEFLIDKIFDIVKDKIIISTELFLNGSIDWSIQEIEMALNKDKRSFYQGIPLTQYWDYYHDIKPMRKYLNSGLIIGKATHLKEVFKWCIDNNYTDDQLALCEYTNKFPEKIYLDYDAKFLHTTTAFVNCSTSNFDYQNKDSPTFQELCGLSGYFLHIPGKGKGQLKIYNMINNLFDNNLIENLFSFYNLKPSSDKYGIKNEYFIK